MSKYIAFLAFIFLVLFSIICYGEISSEIGLGEEKYYITLNSNISVYFYKLDVLTERAYVRVNDKDLELLPLQKEELDNFTFIYAGWDGDGLDKLRLRFVIDNANPINCSIECVNNSFMNIARLFDSNFELCKKNCTIGCNLYMEKKCEGNQLWLIDNCGKKREQLAECSHSCFSGTCSDCGDMKCNFPENFLNCKDCKVKPDFCIGEKDCGEDKKCYFGKCSDTNFVIGDGICSLPEEPCSSQDCSCENSEAKNKSNIANGYPIILFHGFASSAEKMKKLQRYLAYDLNYENGGEISIDDLNCKSNKMNVVYTATFYDKKQKNKEQDRLAQLIQESYSKMAGGEKKVTFTDIFARDIAKAKACSNADKVNIIAHSMGGIVAEEYLANNNQRSIAKLIFLATPFHGGIYGSQSYEIFRGLEAQLGDRKQLLRGCSSIEVPSVVLSLINGKDTIGECQQIEQAGVFSKNPGADESPGLVEYYTLRGDIDGIGDGVVTLEGSELNGSVSKVAKCGHFDLRDPSRCKEGYSYIIEDLGYDMSQIREKTFYAKVKEFVYSIGDFIAGALSNAGFATSQNIPEPDENNSTNASTLN